ncbi:hypothetical protein A9Q99_17945 [Gammaproteobacteria bacterium 45_16_T64]|nr:hypothetical protein A9Q99_17945 [Gammaproteobacteria bacterium 45_16_T64]
MKLNLRAIDLNLLTVFDALMAEGKLSLAAEKLNMTQPAASNALQRLRVTLNDELFIRTRNGMIPTHRAKELHLPIAEALTLIASSLGEEPSFDVATSHRTFTIAATDYGETVLLNRLMAQTQHNRGISFILSGNPGEHHNNRLAQGELDLIIDYTIEGDRNLEYEQLTSEEVVLIANQHHPRIQGQCSKEQYFHEYHVVLPQRGKNARPLETLIDDTLKKRNIAAQVTQFSAMPPLVGDSDLIAVMPRRQAEIFKDAFGLALLPLPFDLPAIPLFQSWHHTRNNDPALLWLRQALIHSLRVG